MVLVLALAWVWKSNMVKENYAAMKRLETEKANLIAENMRLRAALMDSKSLSEIGKIVSAEYGLTQNVSERIFLSDPVKRDKKESKIQFASDRSIPDWLETAVMGTDRVNAESLKIPSKGNDTVR